MSSVDHLLVRTVTLVQPRSYTTDRYGNRQPDWASAERTVVPAWLASASDSTEAGGRVVADAALLLAADVVLDAADRVEVDGISYEVAGAPTVAWRAMPPAPHHVEARLRRVEG